MARLQVRDIAESYGWGIDDLRQRCGLSLDTLQPYWEYQPSAISLEILRVIAEALSVDVGDLLTSRPVPGQARQRSPEQAVAALEAYGIATEVRQRLAAFICEAEDRELRHLNAYYFAERLGLSRRAALALLAPAVLTGIFALHWELYCLACFHQDVAFASFQEARSFQTCKNCHASMHAPLDLELSVTFSVNPAVRQLPAELLDHSWRRTINEQYGVVTGHDLLTTQAFRDLIVSEPLPLHESLVIQKAALLFTDLSESTALYVRRGDPRAFSLVREHFGLLSSAIAEAGGAVVKTIGDAIMAAFPDSELAFAAALAIPRAVEQLNRHENRAPEEQLQIKIGMHCGPCIAVTLNSRLDYFGTTVNAAARVQRLAAPGEIVLTDQLHGDVLASHPELSSLVPEQIALRGIELPFTIYRLRPLT